VNRCLECRRNFPTEHFLNLHIEENHDALVSVRRERGEKTVSHNPPRFPSNLQADVRNSMAVSSKTVIENAPHPKRDECT